MGDWSRPSSVSARALSFRGGLAREGGEEAELQRSSSAGAGWSGEDEYSFADGDQAQSVVARRDREMRVSRALLDNLETSVAALEALRPRGGGASASRRLHDIVNRLKDLDADAKLDNNNNNRGSAAMETKKKHPDRHAFSLKKIHDTNGENRGARRALRVAPPSQRVLEIADLPRAPTLAEAPQDDDNNDGPVGGGRGRGPEDSPQTCSSSNTTTNAAHGDAGGGTTTPACRTLAGGLGSGAPGGVALLSPAVSDNEGKDNAATGNNGSLAGDDASDEEVSTVASVEVTESASHSKHEESSGGGEPQGAAGPDSAEDERCTEKGEEGLSEKEVSESKQEQSESERRGGGRRRGTVSSSSSSSSVFSTAFGRPAPVVTRQNTVARMKSFFLPGLAAPPTTSLESKTAMLTATASASKFSELASAMVEEGEEVDEAYVGSEKKRLLDGAAEAVRRVNQTRRIRQELSRRFHMINADQSGTITEEEFVRALAAAGIEEREAVALFRASDENHDDAMDETEFIALIETNQLNAMWTKDLSKAVRSPVHASACDAPRPFLMLSPNDPWRVAWDMTTAVLLGYVIIVEPVRLSWGFVAHGEASFIRGADIFTDVFFVGDFILNFRTGYVLGPTGNRADLDPNKAAGNCVELDPKKAAWYYATHWAPLDLISSLPPVLRALFFVLGEGGGDKTSGLRAAKLLKMSRVLKMSKMLRIAKIGRLTNLGGDSQLGEQLDDFFFSSKSKALRKCCSVLVTFGVIAHYLACGLRLVGDDYLVRFAPRIAGRRRTADTWPDLAQYLASLYWAVTTMTTVGYGDIIPVTNAERIYTMFAMIIGASTYGYVVASATSIVQSADAQQSSYYEKMDRVHAWLEYHSIPLDVRREVRTYYRHYFQQRTAFDERGMIADLAPAIQQRVADHMLPACIRHNELFANLPKGAISKLVSIVHLMTLGPHSLVVSEGEPCASMFIVYTGRLLVRRPRQPDEYIVAGSSFGEVGILGIANRSRVTATTVSVSSVYLLPQDEFLDAFSRLPEALNEMRYLVVANDRDVQPERKDELLERTLTALGHFIG